jgi:hypothetical protein
MKPFMTSQRKMYELLLLFILDTILYFIWPSFEAVILFTLGFIWNWTASQNLDLFFENGRYRFSMLKMVVNLQKIILKPFKRFPEILKIIPRSLPAGLFWWLVIWFAGSEMPWWATFLGSFVFELTQFEVYLPNRQEEKSP